MCAPSLLQGIFSAATFIHCNTQEALQEAARRCPGWPLLLTGHSLGGGVAALLTMLLQQSGLPPGLGPMRCVTVGTGAAAAVASALVWVSAYLTFAPGRDAWLLPNHAVYRCVHAVTAACRAAAVMSKPLAEACSDLVTSVIVG